MTERLRNASVLEMPQELSGNRLDTKRRRLSCPLRPELARKWWYVVSTRADISPPAPILLALPFSQRVARAVKKHQITGEDAVEALAAFGMNVRTNALTH